MSFSAIWLVEYIYIEFRRIELFNKVAKDSPSKSLIVNEHPFDFICQGA